MNKKNQKYFNSKNDIAGEDFVLKSISDWSHFEDRIKNDSNMKLPHIYLHEAVKIKGCNNIPLPLVQAIIDIKQAFVNSDNVIVRIINE